MKNRLQTLRTILQRNNLDAILISSPMHILYLTEYPGFSEIEREAFILMTKIKNYLITDARYTEQVKKEASSFGILERGQQNSTFKLLQEIINNEKIKILGFEAENLTVAEYKTFKKVGVKFKPVSLRELRSNKTKQEIEAIQKACKIGDNAFTFIIKQIHESVTEKELAYKLENFMRQQGAEPSFASIVAFGPNAAIPHHHGGNTKLKKNQFVLFDFGVKVDNYCSDMSRTVYFGKPTDEEVKAYQTVLIAQQKAEEYITTKLKNKRSKKAYAGETDGIARKYIVSQGFPSFPHSLGHGIGLEVHEAPSLSPRSKNTLTEGMVFTIEPGIYIPGKFGVRIEDDYIIENNKLIQLTQSPKNLIKI